MVTSSTVSPKNDCNVGTLADAILFKDILWKDELFIDMYLFKENIYLYGNDNHNNDTYTTIIYSYSILYQRRYSY